MIKSIKLAVVSATTALALTATGVAVAEEAVPMVGAVVQKEDSEIKAAQSKLSDLNRKLEETKQLLAAAEAGKGDLAAVQAKLSESEANFLAARNSMQSFLGTLNQVHTEKAKQEARRVTRNRTTSLKAANEKVLEAEKSFEELHGKLTEAYAIKSAVIAEKKALEAQQSQIAEYSKMIEETKSSIQEAQEKLDKLSSKAEERKATNSEQNDQQMNDENPGDSKIFSIIAAVLGALGLAGLAARFIPMIMKFFNR
ncbi:hypothetical protein ACEN17_01955 [Corynebacterium rouxii]